MKRNSLLSATLKRARNDSAPDLLNVAAMNIETLSAAVESMQRSEKSSDNNYAWMD